MKKIFTILAATLFAGSMMADVTLADINFKDAAWSGKTFSQGNTNNVDLINGIYFWSKSDKEANQFSLADNTTKGLTFPGSNMGDANYFFCIPLTGINGQITVTIIHGYGSGKASYQYAFVDGRTAFENTNLGARTELKDAKDADTEITFTIDVTNEAAHLCIGRKSSNYPTISGVKVTTPDPVVVNDPVTTVTVAGADACYVGKTITLVASTDVAADEYKWAVDGVEQEGAVTKSFDFTPEKEGTFAIVCSAKNAHNTDWVASAAHSVVATVKNVLEQVDVTGSTTWDWTKAATVSEIKFTETTSPAKNEEVLLANIDDINNNSDFNSQALIFAGEYAVRDGKYCQGQLLQFRTTVAGSIKLEFSNTGGDRPNRFVAVNGVVNTEVGSNSTGVVTSADIPVEAGDVKIEGAFETYDAAAPQYLRIYKLTFTEGKTAIDNTELSATSQKMVENGQLIIIKNGVKYNAQGVAVK